MTLRIATYNVEWMNALFDDRGQPEATNALSARYNITKADQLAALGIVFTALNADGVMIIEAPDQSRKRSTVRALEAFAAHFGLRTRKAIIGFASETEQEIAFLYDPDVLTVSHDPQGPAASAKGAPLGPQGAPRFDTALRHDINADGVDELVVFSKPPLELLVEAGPLTLHEIAQVLVDHPAVLGVTRIERAINCDGGPSAGLALASPSAAWSLAESGPVRTVILLLPP